MYMCMCICIYIYIYTYMSSKYIQFSRATKQFSETYIYIYIYICINSSWRRSSASRRSPQQLVYQEYDYTSCLHCKQDLKDS